MDNYKQLESWSGMVTMQHKESTILQISKETAQAPLNKKI